MTLAQGSAQAPIQRFPPRLCVPRKLLHATHPVCSMQDERACAATRSRQDSARACARMIDSRYSCVSRGLGLARTQAARPTTMLSARTANPDCRAMPLGPELEANLRRIERGGIPTPLGRRYGGRTTSSALATGQQDARTAGGTARSTGVRTLRYRRAP